MQALLDNSAFVIMLLGALVGMACSLLGVFLVLRKTSMLADAISHAVLLGIVVFFFIFKDRTSPMIMVGAGLAGLLTVWLTELLRKSGRVKEDAAIGLVFPGLFALAVLLINLYGKNLHIDVHSVFLGEIIFAPLDRVALLGLEVPRSLVVMLLVTTVNLAFVSLALKELKLTTFDPGLAAALGFSPALIHYGLLGLTSVTAVGAFDAVGAILVIAFIIVPPAAAYLLTDNLKRMLLYSLLISVASSVLGYYAAMALNVSVSGMMASWTGIFFALCLMLGPRYGLIAQMLVRKRKELEYAEGLLLVHLFNHEDTPGTEEQEPVVMQSHLRWGAAKANKVLQSSVGRGLVVQDSQGSMSLTDAGRSLAKALLSGEAYMQVTSRFSATADQSPG